MAGIQGQPSPKPSAVESPVPGAAAASAFDSAEMPAAKAAGSAFDSAAMPDPSSSPSANVPPSQPGIGGQVLDGAMRGLDYPGGFMRAGLASAAGIATGNGEIVTPDDLAAAAKGKGPNSAEYLKRMGVSEGGSLTVPGLGRVTLRGAEGLALDIVTDPLTLVAKTLKEIPYLSKLIGAPGAASEALGEATYKSALTAQDPAKAAEAGRALLENGGAPILGEAALTQKIQDTSNIMGKLRQGLYDKFNELKGTGIDAASADLYKNSNGMLDTLRKNPTLVPLADKLQGLIDTFKSSGSVPIEQMSQWKTQLFDTVGSAFGNGKIPNPAKAFKAALATDFKNAIVESGNKAEAGLGNAIDDINSKWGGLLESKPVTGIGGGSLGKSIDAVALISGGIPAYVKKKALELATGPYGRTLVGNALMNAGQKSFMNSLSVGNSALHDSSQPAPAQQQSPPSAFDQ